MFKRGLRKLAPEHCLPAISLPSRELGAKSISIDAMYY